MIGSIIALVVIGLVIGVVARAVLPGRQSLPIWLTALIGVGGSLLSGLIFGEHHNVIKFIVAVVIAAAIIAFTQGGVKAKSRV